MNDIDSSTVSGLVAAYVLDGKGGGKKLDWDGISRWRAADGVLYVYLDYTMDDAKHWIANGAELDEVVQEALVEEDTRPRSMVFSDCLLANLRVVNFNPGADPEDMVAIRMWFEKDRVILTRHRRVVPLDEMSLAFDRGRGPRTVVDLLIDVTDRIVDRIAQIVENIDDRIDEIEEQMVETKSRDKSNEMLSSVPSVRRQAISLRRYLVPQREAISKIAIERISWMNEEDRIAVREITDRMVRLVEDIEEARDHATVIQDELDSYLARDLNKRIYVLSVVAAIFLPLTFFTGLLGINVGGIPGADHPVAFYIVSIVLSAVGAAMLIGLRFIRWF